MTHRTWTVLPHDPIEKLNDRLWTVSGRMPKGNQRRMVVVKKDDGSLVVHNAIALEDDEMAELDRWGEVRSLIVPNGFHRMDARPFKDRYPKAQVYCPKGAEKAVAKLVEVDGDYTAFPSDSSVGLEHLEGMKNAEGVLRVVSDDGTSLVFNDALLNMESQGLFTDLFLSPVGRLSVPRFSRMMWLKDKRALTAQMQRISSESLKRVIVGHGATVEQHAKERLDEALSLL